MNQHAHANFDLLRIALDAATGGRPSNIAGKKDAINAIAELELEMSEIRLSEALFRTECDQLRARLAAINPT